MDVKLILVSDADMHQFIEKGIRRGVSYISFYLYSYLSIYLYFKAIYLAPPFRPSSVNWYMSVSETKINLTAVILRIPLQLNRPGLLK